MRHETKCGKTTGISSQEFRSSGVTEWFSDHRFAAGREFLAGASDSSGESSPPELLQFRNSCDSFFSRSCTNVFSGIGIKLGDRSLFGGFFDIVDVIPNDLLSLRVVNHH